MNDNLLKMNGVLVLSKGTEQDFINAFSEFLKKETVEFDGTIGSDSIKTGNDMPGIPIDNLSDRVKKILYRENIFDLKIFSTYYEEDITRFRGLGVVGYREILHELNKHGIFPISYIQETTDFKFFHAFERKELYKNNVRTVEDVLRLSETELARLFQYGSRLYIKLINIRKKHNST